MADISILEWIIPYAFSFVFITLFFGSLLAIFAWIYKLKDKSEEAYDANFFLRSFLVAFIAGFVVIFFELLFVFLLFSPFLEGVEVELMNAILSTSLPDVVNIIITSPPAIILVFAIIIVLILLIVGYLLLEAYKVPYLWTTLTVWSAIGVYFLVDLILISTGFENGLAGFIQNIGNSLRDLILGL